MKVKDILDDYHAAKDDVINDALNDVINNELNSNEKNVLNEIRKNPRITAKQIAETLSISNRTAQRVLKSLIEKGLVERVGSKKTGSWHAVRNDE